MTYERQLSEVGSGGVRKCAKEWRDDLLFVLDGLLVADVLEPTEDILQGEGTESKLGTTRGNRLNDTGDVVANQAEPTDISR